MWSRPGRATTEEQILADLHRRLGPVEVVADGPAADVLAAALPSLKAILAGEPVPTAAIPIDLDDRPR